MIRKRKPLKRPLTPDPKFSSVIMARFINKLMKDGKKELARKIFYDAMNKACKEQGIQSTGDADAQAVVDFFETLITNARPLVHVRSKRIGGSTYQVPVDLSVLKGENIAMKWIIETARSESGSSMAESLSKQFSDCYKNIGKIIKKREDTHRMAESNRAFAQYGAWS